MSQSLGFPYSVLSMFCKKACVSKKQQKNKTKKKICIYFKGLRLNQNIYFCACYGLVYLRDSQLQSAHSLSLVLGEAQLCFVSELQVVILSLQSNLFTAW